MPGWTLAQVSISINAIAIEYEYQCHYHGYHRSKPGSPKSNINHLIVNDNFRSECQVFREAGMKEEVFKLSHSIVMGWGRVGMGNGGWEGGSWQECCLVSLFR